MSVQIVNQLPRDVWSAFVERHPDGNIFQTPDMFRVFQEAKGHVPELWAAVDGDQVLAMFVSVCISLGNAWPRQLSARTIVYGSVLREPGADGDAAMSALLQAYKRGSGKCSLFTELRNISPAGDSLPLLLAEGFTYEDHLNYLIGLDRPVAALFAGIGARTRKNIKKGLNKGRVLIVEVTDRAGLEACYRLLSMTYRAAHVPLADRSLFGAAFDILHPKGMIRFNTAMLDGSAAATSVELLYKGVMYGWYGGMDRSFAAFVPNELLTWDILRWGAEHGFSRYDFGGAGKPGEKYGVRDFKSKFGGELVCYGRNTWVANPWLLTISRFGYSALRKFLY